MGSRRGKNEMSDNYSATLAAVALQDHIIKSYGSLSLSNPLNKRKIGKPRPKREVKAVVDTGRGNISRSPAKKELTEKEYVLDPKPAAPSLAQRLGLVDQPNKTLNEDDWRDVKTRVIDREDFKHPCVICKEDLGTQQQVLLSCSHVFHRTCLQAFERFTGRKTCPMCRHEEYQTRVVHDGSKYYRHKCATRIQAGWRGYVVRCWYKDLRQSVPPVDQKLRKKFYEQKLQEVTDRLVQACDNSVDDFLLEMDRNVAASRDVFKHFDDVNREIGDDEWNRIHQKVVERGDTECPICLTALDKEIKHCSGDNIDSHTARLTERQKVSSIKQEVMLNNENSGNNSRKKQTVILSCSHIFHQTCLQSFEAFSVGERRFVCPVCRSSYQKRPVL